MTNPFIPTFCEWLEKSGRSTLTIKSYSADVKKYIAFLEANKIEGSVHPTPLYPLIITLFFRF